MTITKKVRALCLAVLACLLTGCSKLTVDNSVVSELDLQRFLGEWYEVARFDHTPQLADSVKTIVLNEAIRRGYDTKQLIWVRQ